MINIKNKKASGEKLLSIWMFFIWLVITVVIVIGILIFSSGKIDVRESQAGALEDRILNCLSQSFARSTNYDFDVYKQCHLNKEETEKDFYFNVTISNFYDEKVIKQIIGGNKDFATYCVLEEIQQQTGQNIKAENFPKCIFSNKIILFSDIGRKYKVEIIVSSNNIGGRI